MTGKLYGKMKTDEIVGDGSEETYTRPSRSHEVALTTI
jgi:hypothetical protein